MSTDQDNQPDQETTPATATTSGDAGDSFAAFDRKFQRFVGGVHPTKAKAKAAAKDKGATDVEIRSV